MMTKKPVALFYQSAPPPEIDGIKKPVKPGGYSDGGADIGFALRQAGYPVVTPVADPDPTRVFDWVFRDTDQGFAEARMKGAEVFWLNTVLYRGHPVERLMAPDLSFVGQDPALMQKHDDKFLTNELLAGQGLPVARSAQIANAEIGAAWSFPLIIKPIRGRGSAGVTYVRSQERLTEIVQSWLESREYGNSFMLEEVLPGQEITIAVMPPGAYRIHGEAAVKFRPWALKPVKRFNHVDMVAPYNGLVAVVKNSVVLSNDEVKATNVKDIIRACEEAAEIVGAKAPIRIDCRADANGVYKIFDLNMKPNMTGAGRPGRDDQDSLMALAAHDLGWSFADFLLNVVENAWGPGAP